MAIDVRGPPSVNIALVNELAMLTDRMGIDIWEIVDAASTKPYGFMRFKPGPGTGGHCLPVDPFYLSWRARESTTSSSPSADCGRRRGWTRLATGEIASVRRVSVPALAISEQRRGRAWASARAARRRVAQRRVWPRDRAGYPQTAVASGR